MAKFVKWLGAGLGWTIGGPIGALLGFAFGTLVDAANISKYEKRETTTGDFVVSLLVMIAAVMKADTRVVKSELDFVKIYLVKTFGEEETTEMLILLRDLLKKEIPIADITQQIKQKMDYSSRLALLHLIYGIASADGTINVAEASLLEILAGKIGITGRDIGSIKAMFVKSTDWAYEILEVNREATEEDIKKSYRQLALKNHPDRVTYLGDDIRKKAEEKFSKISQAYDVIKQERGLAL